ncbi:MULTISPECIES: hypothetical protein [Streptomyces]|uniref:Uncharacterized protein n=1 Tax=Streptomyces noboritoensis TaxID=67337 RepID=A0ABV6TAM1_9ACTN
MTVLSIYSPGTLTTGGSGFNSASQAVSNPFATPSAVWIQCTTKYVAGNGQSDFGISQVNLIDDNGQFQAVNYGDDHFGTYLARLYVPRLLGLTVIARTYDAAIEGTLTLFSWG